MGGVGLTRAKSQHEFTQPGSLQRRNAFVDLETRSENVACRTSNLYLPPVSKGEKLEKLVLPPDISDVNLDEYLSRIPRVASRAHELYSKHASEDELEEGKYADDFDKDSAFIRRASTGRCLNVLQGEVAHASSLQADILVSAEATTCHVVALRSTKSANVPLVSLAHVDQAGAYDHCLENMVQEHLKHHSIPATGAKNAIDPEQDPEASDDDFFFFEDAAQDLPEDMSGDITVNEDEEPSFLPKMNLHKSASMPMLPEEPVEMELHLVGGYLDKNGTSRKLSNSLIAKFSDLADKYQGRIRISLSTAAISCMNTSSEEPAPRSRGLGIDTRTGEVFPIHSSLPKNLEGPGLEIRSARAFARMSQRGPQSASLHCIHDRDSLEGHVKVQPFRYEPIPAMNALLTIPDNILLQYTSTSPNCESARFCSDLRRTVSFVNTVDSRDVFGHDCQRPLVYTRSAHNLNEWEQVLA